MVPAASGGREAVLPPSESDRRSVRSPGHWFALLRRNRLRATPARCLVRAPRDRCGRSCSATSTQSWPIGGWSNRAEFGDQKRREVNRRSRFADSPAVGRRLRGGATDAAPAYAVAEGPIRTIFWPCSTGRNLKPCFPFSPDEGIHRFGGDEHHGRGLSAPHHIECDRMREESLPTKSRRLDSVPAGMSGPE